MWPTASLPPPPAKAGPCPKRQASASLARPAAPAPQLSTHSDFDAARVARIREEISAGRYQVNTGKIADGLLATVRDLLAEEKMSGALLNLLHREHAATGLFLELLVQEAQAMTEGAFAELPGLAERKSHLADQITLIGRRREAQQLALGYGPGRSGADAAAAAGDAALKSAWQQVLARAGRSP